MSKSIVQITMSETSAKFCLATMVLSRNSFMHFWTRSNGEFDGDVAKLLRYDQIIADLQAVLGSIARPHSP